MSSVWSAHFGRIVPRLSAPDHQGDSMRRTAVLLPLTVAALLPAPAFAASGSLTDPDDPSIADVLRLGYDNRANKVVMKMSYDAHRPQVENFYVKWGTAGKYYKLQRSAGNGTTLWFSN